MFTARYGLNIILLNLSVYNDRCDRQRHNKRRRFQLLFVGNFVLPKSTVAAAVSLAGRCAEHNGTLLFAATAYQVAAAIHCGTRSS